MHGDPDLHEIVEWLNLYLEEYSRHPVPAQFKISFLKRSYCAWRLQNLDHTNNKKLNPQICAQIQILDFMNNKLDLSIPGNTEHVEKITTTVEEIQPYQATLDQFNQIFDNLEQNEQTFELYLNTNLWVQVRKYLEGNSNVCFDGMFRGRVYWHRKTRPRITTRNIAEIISKILEKEEREARWLEILEPLEIVLNKIHTHTEGDSLAQVDGEPIFPNAILGINVDYGERNYRLEGIAIGDVKLYTGPYNSKLELWIKNAYTQDWFAEYATAIQVHYRRHSSTSTSRIVRGSARGRWKHPSTKLNLTKNKSDLFKSLANLTAEFERVANRFNDPEDRVAIRQALLIQLRSIEE